MSHYNNSSSYHYRNVPQTYQNPRVSNNINNQMRSYNTFTNPRPIHRQLPDHPPRHISPQSFYPRPQPSYPSHATRVRNQIPTDHATLISFPPSSRSNHPLPRQDFFSDFDNFFHDFNEPFFAPRQSNPFSDLFSQINFFLDSGLRRTSRRRNRDRNLIELFFGQHSGHQNMFDEGFDDVFHVRNSGLDIGQVLQLLVERAHGNSQQVRPGNVNRMKDVRVNSEVIRKCKVCTVCQEDFKVGEAAKELPCEHYFHEDCITPWLQSQNTCPMCRATI